MDLFPPEVSPGGIVLLAFIWYSLFDKKTKHLCRLRAASDYSCISNEHVHRDEARSAALDRVQHEEH